MTFDLRSDTVTKPTRGMRTAMAQAEVGDDERDGDPTMRRLEERVAALLGKEAALFFPSGVMANQAAVWVHVPRGTEVLADVDAHLVHSEIAGVGALSGAQVLAVNPRGAVMNADDLRAGVAPGVATIPLRSRLRGEHPQRRGRQNHVDGRPPGDPRGCNGARSSGPHGRRALVERQRGQRRAALGVCKLRRDRHGRFLQRVGCADRRSARRHASGHGKGVDSAQTFWRRHATVGNSRGRRALRARLSSERLADDHANARTLANAVNGAGGATVVDPDTNIVMIDLAPGRSAADVV